MLYHIFILQNELTQRLSRNPNYSLRAFARSLGVNSGLLSVVLNSKRPMSYKMAQQIMERLELDPKERDRFLLSLSQEHTQRNVKRLHTLSFVKIGDDNWSEDRASNQMIENEKFKFFSEWYHLALLEMTQLINFRSSFKWMASELQINELDVKMAIDRLLQLGLIIKDEDGNYKKTSKHLTSSDKSSTNLALKKLQKDLLRKAIESIDDVEFERRVVSALTMAIDPSKISEAKVLIFEFVSKMSQFLETGSQSQVYQLNVVLYPLQKPNESKKRKIKHKVNDESKEDKNINP